MEAPILTLAKQYNSLILKSVSISEKLKIYIMSKIKREERFLQSIFFNNIYDDDKIYSGRERCLNIFFYV